MDTNIDNLKKLLDRIKLIGFWDRLFSWGTVREQLVDATADVQKLVSNADSLQREHAALSATHMSIEKDLRIANESLIRKEGDVQRTITMLQETNARVTELNKQVAAKDTIIATNTETTANLTTRKNELDIELAGIKVTLENIRTELRTVKQQNTELLAGEDTRRTQYAHDVATLTAIREQIQQERTRETEERNEVELTRIKGLKETWSRHEDNIKSLIKNICNKLTVEYVDKVPFKGEPDNTMKICEEYVIFDAKSPASDDLGNFPTYLKDQAERAKKYAKQDGVKTDIFFVVPSNTLERLTTFVFNLGDHNVFIISVDSLEQIILGLKKIEEYEFAEQLSPEERDNICRVLGKFAHLTKRRIQIDSFFAKQFIELAYKSETDLPPEILEKVVAYERSEKLNPPVEKRAKAISIKELEKDTLSLNTEVAAKGILIDDLKISNGLNGLELYLETPGN
jgi:hypothetical protein